jgi:signal transduction histidine kinase
MLAVASPGPESVVPDATDRGSRGRPLRAYFGGLIALLVLAAASASFYVSAQADHDARAQARQDASFAAKTAAGQLGNFVQVTRSTVAQLAANPQISQVLTHPKGCTLSFLGIVGPDQSHLDILRADGTVACSSRPPTAAQPRRTYAGTSWLKRALRGPVFIAPAKDARTGGKALISAAPIAGGRGVVAGFGDLAEVGPELVSLFGGGRPVEFVVTTDGGRTVVARSIAPRRWIGASLAATPFGRAVGKVERQDADGVTRFYAGAGVPGTPWRFEAGEEKAASLAGYDRLKQQQLLIVLAGLAAAIVAVWLIFRSVVAPIRRLGAALRATSALPEPLPVPAAGPREIVRLADDVNSLIAAVARELEERQRAEAQLVQSNKMEAVGQLAGGVAHDFNNLLTAIGGYADLARRRSDDPEVTRNLDAVLDAAERAGELTHHLLAFSRRQVLQLRPLDLNDVVADAEKLLRRLIGEDIRTVTSLSPDLGAVTADASQLSQVLMNLAVNARDAMPDGGTLTIETTNVDLDHRSAQALFDDAEPGPYVRLSVSDTGVGIPEEAMGRLFEPFFTTKEVGAGTGLGLSMVFGIVKQSGGYVTVYSEPGEGAVFNIYLPRTNVRPEPRAPAAPRLSRGSERLLLVEDEDVVRELVTEMLEGQGYVVTSTGSPEEALTLSENGSDFDLLITDVVMPRINGPQLVEALSGGARKPRVMYVSGYTSAGMIDRGVLDSDVAFLQKPFALGDLAAKVRETLDRPS